MTHMLIFGMGFSGRAVAARMAAQGWRITGTSRSAGGVAAIEALGHEGRLYDGTKPGAGIAEALNSATHVLVSAGPDADGDPVLAHHAQDLAQADKLSWLGYFSTVGVYGDFGGAWIDEDAELKPASTRGHRRVGAEIAWRAFAAAHARPVDIFRLAGIYGPGRSPLSKLEDGTARRIAKPGQVFNRIHVEDIAGVVAAAIANLDATSLDATSSGGASSDATSSDAASSAAVRIFNVADNEPAPPQDVVVYAASLLGIEPPPEIAFASADMTPMARSFYGENKKVSNARLKDELGYELRYPTFREGLQALVRAGS